MGRTICCGVRSRPQHQVRYGKAPVLLLASCCGAKSAVGMYVSLCSTFMQVWSLVSRIV